MKHAPTESSLSITLYSSYVSTLAPIKREPKVIKVAGTRRVPLPYNRSPDKKGTESHKSSRHTPCAVALQPFPR